MLKHFLGSFRPHLGSIPGFLSQFLIFEEPRRFASGNSSEAWVSFRYEAAKDRANMQTSAY